MEHVGDFEVCSGELVVTDPCYGFGVWCQGVLPAKNGVWKSFINRVGDRVHLLSIYHEEYLEISSAWVAQPFEVGVDSGQAGFFDKAFASKTKEEDYDKICELSNPAGSLEYGVVSSSGYGDGGYDCYASFDKDGKVVAAYIEFINSNKDYDDDENEYCGDPD